CDPINRIKLFSNLRILEIHRKPFEADPALLNPHFKKDMEKLFFNYQRHLVNVITLNYQNDSPEFLESYMNIRPQDGFGVPDTRIEPNEPLLIR
ncbi:hypothetical protein OAM01_00150, partial [bacterium]|nr:hypothetical protein [bacterium]